MIDWTERLVEAFNAEKARLELLDQNILEKTGTEFLQAENEKLRHEFFRLMEEAETTTAQWAKCLHQQENVIAELEAENERLRKEIERIKED